MNLLRWLIERTGAAVWTCQDLRVKKLQVKGIPPPSPPGEDRGPERENGISQRGKRKWRKTLGKQIWSAGSKTA